MTAMARQTNAAYWAQRLKHMEGALLDQSFGYVENMERQFAAAQAEVERQIAAWYQRFADANGITFADAKRLLTKGELAEFHWTVGEYIAHGQQNALDGAWMRQLENASARVHITRLEALKLQIQQQAELLYANQLDFVDAAARRIYAGSYYGTAFEVQRGLGVGWTMQALNEGTIKKVLSRPWTADDKTFRDRCWTNKRDLVNSVNTQLTQMIIRGEAPDRAIAAVAKQFQVSKGKAGRLIMTESAYFASAAQKDCYGELGVERYKIVASFDQDTCELCGALDGQVFKMSEYQPGLTAPPFHPWCRCCTAPYFEDMAALGERWTRNPDGTTKKVPADMTFADWRQQFVQQGQGLTDAAKQGKINPWGFNDIQGDHTIADDIGTAQSPTCNPNFAKGGDYTYNCGYCSATYEMRRRGFDVEAQPLHGLLVSDWKNLFTGGKAYPFMKEKRVPIVETLTKQIKGLHPDGARGSVFVQWKGSTWGHFFSWERQGETVLFIDPQCGGIDVAEYFKRVKPESIIHMRWDNLEPSDAIKNACINKG